MYIYWEKMYPNDEDPPENVVGGWDCWELPPNTEPPKAEPEDACARFPKVIVFWVAKFSNVVDCCVAPNPKQQNKWPCYIIFVHIILKSLIWTGIFHSVRYN